jgi:acetyl/propionyl-CoA carboxylase alpha subunit
VATEAKSAGKAASNRSAAGASRNTVIVIVPILLVLITFLFWYQTWFGRTLSDAEMAEDLTGTAAPHKTQHALAQLSDRMARGDEGAQRWYPQLLALAHSGEAQLRLESAWAMGQDNRSETFHQALRNLLDDPVPLVRWNAALALVRFNDGSGEAQIRTMLQPFTLPAPGTGTIRLRLKVHDNVRNGSIMARLRPNGNSQQQDVLSPLGGTITTILVNDGAAVAAGDPLAVIAPDEGQVMESLRALYLVGQPQDLAVVQSFAGAANASARVRQQAAATLRAIEERAGKGKS